MSVDMNPPPRWKRNSTGETARNAAHGVARATPNLRQRTYDLIKAKPRTGEDVLEELRKQGVQTVLYSVKPRLSELRQMGLVTDSGQRGKSDSGKFRSIVWRACEPEEIAAFHEAKAEAEAAAAREAGAHG